MTTVDTTKRCDLTELLVRDCAHCRGLPDRPVDDPNADIFGEQRHADRVRPGQFSPWFAARFGGECSDCGRDFAPGESIRRDGDGGYVGECCA